MDMETIGFFLYMEEQEKKKKQQQEKEVEEAEQLKLNVDLKPDLVRE